MKKREQNGVDRRIRERNRSRIRIVFASVGNRVCLHPSLYLSSVVHQTHAVRVVPSSSPATPFFSSPPRTCLPTLLCRAAAHLRHSTTAASLQRSRRWTTTSAARALAQSISPTMHQVGRHLQHTLHAPEHYMPTYIHCRCIQCCCTHKRCSFIDVTCYLLVRKSFLHTDVIYTKIRKIAYKYTQTHHNKGHFLESNITQNGALSGGGFSLRSSATATIECCLLQHNSAISRGGCGIIADRSSLTFRNNTVAHNQSENEVNSLLQHH